MRFYRLTIISLYGNDCDTRWFSSRSEAERTGREWARAEVGSKIEIDAIDITPTKAGLIAALNQYASPMY